MLIPRSGLTGLALNMLDKQYNTISEKHNLYADKVYDVPFIGQNHTNLCGDAAAFMLARWAKHVLPGVTNLKYRSDGYSNLRDFLRMSPVSRENRLISFEMRLSRFLISI